MSRPTLFLDFASNAKCMAVVDDTKVSLQPIPDHTDESAVLPLIRELSPLEEIGRIVATTGPGGFMSLRVGLSIANALAWSLKIPIAGVHLSDLWYARAATNYKLPTTNFFWLHSTKKEFLFVRGFGIFEKEWPTPILVSVETLRSKLQPSSRLRPASKTQSSKLDYVGELIPEQMDALGLTQCKDVVPLESILPPLCDSVAYGKPPLLPWYGRGG